MPSKLRPSDAQTCWQVAYACQTTATMDRTAARIANSAARVLNLDCRLTARARGISVMLAFSGIAGTRISADISHNAAATKAAKAPKALTHCKDVILPSGSARRALRRRLDQSDARRRGPIRSDRPQQAFGTDHGPVAQEGTGDGLAERRRQ